jgi:hypothetical protein
LIVCSLSASAVEGETLDGNEGFTRQAGQVVHDEAVTLTTLTLDADGYATPIAPALFLRSVVCCHMDFRWTTVSPTELVCTSGPLTMKLVKKGDGRWSWHVFKDASEAAMATGLAASLGAAKTVTQQFAMRSGLV